MIFFLIEVMKSFNTTLLVQLHTEFIVLFFIFCPLCKDQGAFCATFYIIYIPTYTTYQYYYILTYIVMGRTRTCSDSSSVFLRFVRLYKFDFFLLLVLFQFIFISKRLESMYKSSNITYNDIPRYILMSLISKHVRNRVQIFLKVCSGLKFLWEVSTNWKESIFSIVLVPRVYILQKAFLYSTCFICINRIF